MPSPTSVIVDGVPAGHSIEVPGRDGRGLRRAAVVLAVLAGVLLVGAVVIGASAWNPPEATLFRSQWWSLLAAVPAPAATCATLGSSSPS